MSDRVREGEKKNENCLCGGKMVLTKDILAFWPRVELFFFNIYNI